ncbi:MAG: hypothetical protein SW833_24045, partial [Cyanobacteriota bacterium]|nr:hypothetical protein [Cyanobacteriota bacterium]
KEGFTDYLNLYKASLYSYLAYVFSAHFLRLWLNNFFSKPYLYPISDAQCPIAYKRSIDISRNEPETLVLWGLNLD